MGWQQPSGLGDLAIWVLCVSAERLTLDQLRPGVLQGMGLTVTGGLMKAAMSQCSWRDEQ